MEFATRHVIDLFLKTLSRSIGWKKIFLISPWFSELDEDVSLPLQTFVKRAVSDQATLYVVTRKPDDLKHKSAIDMLGQSNRANVALVANLHTKLYCASTNTGSFAMIGSANFTKQSLENREIGMLVNAFGVGKKIVSNLTYEASQVYRLPGRNLIYKANF